MEAKVTLVATPREFDLLRKAAEDQMHELLAIGRSGPNNTADGATKRAANERAAELSQLLTRLK